MARMLGILAAALTAHPALVLTARAPLTVHGTGFVAHERVALVGGGVRTAVRSSALGGFTVRLGTVDRCSGGRVVATGARGDRAVLRLPPLLCAPASTP
jgi:hypothetical protein